MLKAELTRDVATFTKMDPFVKVEYSNSSINTLVQYSKGKKPVFD